MTIERKIYDGRTAWGLTNFNNDYVLMVFQQSKPSIEDYENADPVIIEKALWKTLKTFGRKKTGDCLEKRTVRLPPKMWQLLDNHKDLDRHIFQRALAKYFKIDWVIK